METWVEDIFRGFFAMLDSVIYWFVELLINLFDSIARLQLFDGNTMGSLADRLFALISIAMIFKVSFSIIQFIINPSAFNDAEKGMGKIVQNIVLVLICLVGAKYIFQLSYNLQNDIITSNVIPQIILGKGEDEGNYVTPEEQEAYKRQIPYIVASVFVTPSLEISGVTYDNGYSYGGKPIRQYNKGKCVINSSLVSKLNNLSLQNDYYFKQEGADNPGHYKAGTAFKTACSTNNYELLFNITSAKNKDNTDVYLFNYKYLISTATGVFLIIMYVNFCIDLAIRVVKLGFLQLISPIPIISMVDPKSSKSGIMSKWVNNYISTYLGLFIRVAAINFVIFTIDAIVNNSEIAGHSLFDFITVVTIFGALMFAKELPKLISDLTGVDLKGDFKLNPLKRVPVAEKALGIATAGALGAAGGIAANTLATARNWGQSSGGERFSSLAGILTGGVSAGFRGLTSKEKNPFKAAGAGIQGSVTARNLRDARREAGNGGVSGFMNRRANDISNWAGIESGASRYDKQISAYDEYIREADNLKSYIDGKLDENGNVLETDYQYDTLVERMVTTHNPKTGKTSQKMEKVWETRTTRDLNVLKNNIDYLKSVGADSERLTKATTLAGEAQKQARQDYITSQYSSNPVVQNAISNMNYIARTNSNYDGFENLRINDFEPLNPAGAKWDQAIKDIKAQKGNLTASEEYRQAQVNKRDKGK